MTRQQPSLLFMSRLLVCGVLLSTQAAWSLLAQDAPCASNRDRPAVCKVEFYVTSGGQREQEIDPRSAISMATNERLQLTLDSFDQFQRRFPEDRLFFGYEVDSRCRGLVTVRELQTGRFEFQSSSTSGSCRMWIWIPGNMNLEWPLELKVESNRSLQQKKGYTRSESQILATVLYRGLLSREPDAAGLRDTIEDIEKGKLGERIRQILKSSEYANSNRGKDASTLLTQLYSGLLDRAPDGAGMATFLTKLQAGRVADVTLDLVHSEEFEQRVLGRP